MRALIFADRDSRPLAPLDREYAYPRLPLAGKELIRYTIDDLVGAGVDELVFVVADQAGRLERLLGDGRRWGARFRFVLGRGGERPSALWPRIGLGGDEPLLVLRGDLLRAPAAGDFLAAVQGEPGTALFGLGEDPRGGLLLLRSGHADAGDWLDLLAVDDPAAVPASGCLRLPRGAVRVLADLPGYHRACLDLVAGRIEGLDAGGRELALGLRAGLRAQVSPRSLKQGRAYVGDNSRVHPEAELLGDVMIARDAVIDRAAALYDCVILPHSYVGELLEVADAIVAGDTLMRVDTGVTLTLTDAFLLGRLDGAAAQRKPRLRDRLLGLLLLVLSLPLWPLAAAAALGARGARAGGAGGTALLQAERLTGNRCASGPPARAPAGLFTAWRFATRIPVLALLPRLLAVVRGDLRLVGVSPLTPEESASRSEDWQRVRDQAAVGLIGPTQLLLPAGAPLDERLMSDAFYAGQPDRLKDLRLLGSALRALLSARAWAPPQGGEGADP